MATLQEALDRIWSDEGLRKRLLSDPKPILREFGLTFPESVSVKIHENTPTLMNAVLPKKPAQLPINPSNDPITRTLERAWTDAAFKKRLLSDPKEAVAEMGVRLPESMDLKIWENTDTLEHMVLPMNPSVTELSDADLEAVAGGGVSKGVGLPAETCSSGGGTAGKGGSVAGVLPVGPGFPFGAAPVPSTATIGVGCAIG